MLDFWTDSPENPLDNEVENEKNYMVAADHNADNFIGGHCSVNRTKLWNGGHYFVNRTKCQLWSVTRKCQLWNGCAARSQAGLATTHSRSQIAV
jgi:hypothetical protein